jgi:hypothetical protein
MIYSFLSMSLVKLQLHTVFNSSPKWNIHSIPYPSGGYLFCYTSTLLSCTEFPLQQNYSVLSLLDSNNAPFPHFFIKPLSNSRMKCLSASSYSVFSLMSSPDSLGKLFPLSFWNTLVLFIDSFIIFYLGDNNGVVELRASCLLGRYSITWATPSETLFYILNTCLPEVKMIPAVR